MGLDLPTMAKKVITLDGWCNIILVLVIFGLGMDLVSCFIQQSMIVVDFSTMTAVQLPTPTWLFLIITASILVIPSFFMVLTVCVKINRGEKSWD